MTTATLTEIENSYQQELSQPKAYIKALAMGGGRMTAIQVFDMPKSTFEESESQSIRQAKKTIQSAYEAWLRRHRVQTARPWHISEWRVISADEADEWWTGRDWGTGRPKATDPEHTPDPSDAF